MQDRKTQDEEVKKNVLQKVIKHRKDHVHNLRLLNLTLNANSSITNDIITTMIIKEVYNGSQGDLNSFINLIKDRFNINQNDNRVNPILEDGFNAIQKHCGQEFNIETMNALNGERACCWRMLFGNNTDRTDYRNFKILYDFIQGQEIINYATIAAEDDSLKIALRECLNERFAAIGHNL